MTRVGYLTAMGFWSRGRARKSNPELQSDTSSPPVLPDLSAELEPAESHVGPAAISGRPSRQPRDNASVHHVSGVHTRLTLQRSHTIYHVGGREIPTEAAVTGPALEHLHDLCQRLLGADERARVILIASEPAARSAKSYVAAQLANLLSGEYGPSVLALEADPGEPALHKALGFAAPRGYGLCEQLAQLTGQPTGRVSVVQLNQRLAALVASEPAAITPEWQACFSAVLTQVRTEHEYIILDGPAVGGEADLQHLRQVDGVLFVTLEGTKLTQTLATVAEHLPNSPLIRIVEISRPEAPRAPRSSWRSGLRKR
jgi:Mrp family chromosome partitioning ATPase